MKYSIFVCVLLFTVSLVFLQGLLSWADGFLTQKQMRSRGITVGWSFFEHGGMWADVFIISPILAYLFSTRHIPFYSGVSILMLTVGVILCLLAGAIYRERGLRIPEAHTRNGHTTLAGWVHGVFAVFAFWTLSLFYLEEMTPVGSDYEVLAISAALVPFTLLGVTKFNRHWRMSKRDGSQIAAELIILGGLTAWHLSR